MCGIAGIINLNGRPVAESDLRKMTDTIRHRGPDGEGFYTFENVGFGHRRLAIIDLSPDGRQPMQHFGCTITFNGEIYNYLELREDLQKKGFQFHTASDTEVLLAAYRHWGTDCVNQLNGMWAFAIHDQEKGKIFCSRDRFGEKPFYYIEQDGQFVFGSEIRAVRAVLSNQLVPNETMMARFLVFEQAEHFNETFFKEVYKLPAAHNLEIDLRSGSIKMNRYYSPRRVDTWNGISEQDAIEELGLRLKHSVALRLRSDVEVGTCLSGGLDSSSIAAVASPLIGAKQACFTAITAGCHEREFDERPNAKQVAEKFGLQWLPIVPEFKDVTAVLLEFVDAQEEPVVSMSPIMQHFVMQRANKSGVQVLLDGQGADEIFLGYLPHLAWVLKSLNGCDRLSLAINSVRNMGISLADLLSVYFYHTNLKYKRKRQLNKWHALNPKYRTLLMESDQVDREASQDLFTRQVDEMFNGKLSALLRYEDKNAMHFSLETRLPFLEPNIVEFALNLPTSLRWKDGWSKYLLRQTLARHLPGPYVWQTRKRAFEAPASWTTTLTPYVLNSKTGALFRSTLFNDRNPRLSTDMNWRLASIVLWHQLHFDEY